MTEQRFQRINSGNGHSYRLDGHKIPGATTVIGTLDKPALVGWAAKESASYAVENWDRLSGLGQIERFDAIKDARFDTNKKAVVRGNRIHALGERLAKGEQVDVPDEITGPVEAYARFLDLWDFETLSTESPVCRTDYRYAGTLDAIVKNDRFGTVLLDVKTGSKVYSEVSLQLAAYRYANVMLEEVVQVGPRGGKKPSLWVEKPMIPVDRAMVAHVLADTVELVPVVADEQIWSTFLFLVEVYETWIRRTDWKMRDDPAFSPTVGKPIFPEDVDDD